LAKKHGLALDPKPLARQGAGEIESGGHSRGSAFDAFFGRGFDAPHLRLDSIEEMQLRAARFDRRPALYLFND